MQKKNLQHKELDDKTKFYTTIFPDVSFHKLLEKIHKSKILTNLFSHLKMNESCIKLVIFTSRTLRN